jgi:hypothetical protein
MASKSRVDRTSKRMENEKSGNSTTLLFVQI